MRKNKFPIASFQLTKAREITGKPRRYLGIASFIFVILACVVAFFIITFTGKMTLFSAAIILMILVFLGWMTFKIAYPETNDSIIKAILKIFSPLLVLEFIYELIKSIIFLMNNINKNSILRVIFLIAITIFFIRLSVRALTEK